MQKPAPVRYICKISRLLVFCVWNMFCMMGLTFATGVSVALVVKRLTLAIRAQEVQPGHGAHDVREKH